MPFCCLLFYQIWIFQFLFLAFSLLRCYAVIENHHNGGKKMSGRILSTLIAWLMLIAAIAAK